jgi:hypothetical protein
MRKFLSAVIDQPVFKNTTYIRKSKFHVNKRDKKIYKILKGLSYEIDFENVDEI